MTANRTNPGETARKAAVAAYEALPAILLAAALLMPALAAFAQRSALPADFERQAVDARTSLGLSIAAQGNQALADIRAETRIAARANLVLPELP